VCAGGGEEICDPPCDEPSYAGGALPGALYFCDILRVGGELVLDGCGCGKVPLAGWIVCPLVINLGRKKCSEASRR